MNTIAVFILAAIAQNCGGGPDLRIDALVIYEADTLPFASVADMTAGVEAAGYHVVALHQSHDYSWQSPLEPPYNYGPGHACMIDGDGVYDEVPAVYANVAADVIILCIWAEYGEGPLGCAWTVQTTECNVPPYPSWWNTAIIVMNVAPDACMPDWESRLQVVDSALYVNNTPYDVANYQAQPCPGDHDGDGTVGTNDLLIASHQSNTEPLLATLTYWGVSCGGEE